MFNTEVKLFNLTVRNRKSFLLWVLLFSLFYISINLVRINYFNNLSDYSYIIFKTITSITYLLCLSKLFLDRLMSIKMSYFWVCPLWGQFIFSIENLVMFETYFRVQINPFSPVITIINIVLGIVFIVLLIVPSKVGNYEKTSM